MLNPDQLWCERPCLGPNKRYQPLIKKLRNILKYVTNAVAHIHHISLFVHTVRVQN